MVGELSGASVFDSLRRAAAAARNDASAAEAVAGRVRAQIHAVTNERLRAVEQLASTQLPELTASTVTQAMPEFRADLLDIEQQRQRRAFELQQSLANLEAAMTAASGRLADLTGRLDAVVHKRDALRTEAGAQLAKLPGYEPMCLQATQAEVRLARDIGRCDELAAEAKVKLPPYEKSRLFLYLWRRRFGTPDYGKRGFVARMDRRLADYTGFVPARASYEFLSTTPKIVRLTVERRREEVKELRLQLHAMEAAAEAAAGVPAVLEEGEGLGREREGLVAEISVPQERTAAAHAAIRTEVSSRGTFHATALVRLTEFLSHAEAAMLERQARATVDPSDDRLTAQIRAWTEELIRIAAEAPPLEAEARRLDAIADGIEDLLVRFRRSEFDSGRSYFRSADVDGILRGLRDGRERPEDTWQTLCSMHFFRESPVFGSTHRTDNVLRRVGLAMQVVGAVADIALSSSGRGGGGFSIGSCRGSGFGRGFGGGGGFTSGKGF
ncbi:MAG: hypothetical protein ABIP94_21760 [Planctomycetota bacterium]